MGFGNLKLHEMMELGFFRIISLKKIRIYCARADVSSRGDVADMWAPLGQWTQSTAVNGPPRTRCTGTVHGREVAGVCVRGSHVCCHMGFRAEVDGEVAHGWQ